MSKKVDFSLMFSQGLEEQLSDIRSGKVNLSNFYPVLDESSSTHEYIHAEQGAALSNWFLPDTLFDPNFASEKKEAILSQLSAFCSVKKSEKMEWLLDKDRRASVLQQLVDSGTLTSRLNSALPETDRTGVLLRELLSGVYGTSVKTTGREDLLSLSSALELLSRLNIPKPSLSQVRVELEGGFLSEYDVLLKDFVGRQAELKDLERFLRTKNNRKLFSSVVLWGLGGAGKSTILAKFLKNVNDRNVATVIVLDFDKPGIDASDTYWLESEIIKQLGQQYPELRDEFNYYRAIARRENIRQTANQIPNSTSKHRVETSILSSAIKSLKSSKNKAKPFLLVLDTLEEVSQREHSIALIDWLYRISSEWSPINFKVIFSGRLFDQDRETFKRPSDGHEIPVEEFDKEVTKHFLKNQGLSEKDIKVILTKKLFPFRPLELKLVARVVKQDPNFSWEELEKAAENGGAQKELFLGIVYRRVLTRIENPVSRKLAYPGLVLRYLTVPLVQEVLVPVINSSEDAGERISPMTDSEAQQALDELALHGWLSYRGPNNEVYHRKDLRRSMLRLMVANDKEKANMLHEKAIEYFTNRNSASDRSDAVYHRLMLFSERGDNQDVSIEEIIDAKSDISQDLLDLPKPAAILVRFALQRDVKQADIDLLPDRYFMTAYSELGKKLVRTGSYGKISNLITRKKRLDKSKNVEFWEAEALFKTIAWSLLRKSTHSENIKAGSSYYPLNVIDRYYYNFFIEPRFSRGRNSREKFIAITRTLSEAVFSSRKYNPRGIFQKIAHCCIRVNAIKKLHKSELEFVDQFLEWYYSKKTTGYDFVCDRAINLIEFVSSPKENDFLCTPGSIKLETRWLYEVAEYLGEDKALIKDAAEYLRPDKRKGLSVKKVLSKIDSLARNKIKSRFLVPLIKRKLTKTKLVSLVRGPDPEFRDLCRYALLECYHKTEHYVQLGNIFEKTIALPIDDFEDGTFLQLMQTDPEKCLEDYIEITDRCWALGKLLQLTTKEKPKGSKLLLVYSQWKEWDKATRLAVSNAILSPVSVKAKKAAKKVGSKKAIKKK